MEFFLFPKISNSLQVHSLPRCCCPNKTRILHNFHQGSSTCRYDSSPQPQSPGQLLDSPAHRGVGLDTSGIQASLLSDSKYLHVMTHDTPCTPGCLCTPGPPSSPPALPHTGAQRSSSSPHHGTQGGSHLVEDGPHLVQDGHPLADNTCLTTV